MAALLTIENVIQTANLSIKLTIKLIDDWKNVVPEAKALQKECELFQLIIHLVVNKPSLPISSILQDVTNTINDTNKLINDFLNDDKCARSLVSKVGWKMHRPWLAHKLRPTFESTTKHLEACKESIKCNLGLSFEVNRPTAHSFRDDMVNDICFGFWVDIFGEEVQGDSWSIFTDAYQQRYNVSWNNNIIERIRRLACGNGIHLTIHGYIRLTKLCDFPLKIDRLPLLTDTHPNVSSETRMEVVSLISKLIKDYSIEEMYNLMVAIFTWYKGYDHQDRQAWQARANEWAQVNLANFGIPTDQLDELGKLAERVNIARRAYLSFFQRYMAVFKFGPLSEDMFDELGFPNEADIVYFIKFIEPLDYANFLVVTHGNPEDWESKEPKVYKFLKKLIASERGAQEGAS